MHGGGWSADAEMLAGLHFHFFCLFAFAVGGLGFEFSLFVIGWRHAFRSEWPVINAELSAIELVYVFV